jgi:hypothetical protein
MTISIWYRPERGEPEVIDRASSEREAGYLAHEYAMAFGTLPGQFLHGKARVWAGRRDQEPRAQ